MKNKTILISIFALFLSACGQAEPTIDPNQAMTQAFATVNAAFTQTALANPTNTPAPTETPTPTAPPQPTAFVPPTILSITVNTGVAYCRFGPDPVYVARFGLRYGKTLEAIGRNEPGDWLLVREVGGAKSCWSSASLFSVSGEVFSLAVAPVVWVTTEKYPPPASVNAARAADQVQVTWSEVTISDIRDIYLEGRYLVQVWSCNGGVLVPSLIGTNELTATFIDQPGCAEPSHGQVYTSTKDGYSLPAPIPWPAP